MSLYRLVGSPEVMAAQMRHILDVSALPNVTLQVLPLIAHAANASGLVITDSAAYCEHMAGGYAYADPVIVSSLAGRASESRAMLERMHEQWETGASLRIPTPPAGSA